MAVRIVRNVRRAAPRETFGGWPVVRRCYVDIAVALGDIAANEEMVHDPSL